MKSWIRVAGLIVLMATLPFSTASSVLASSAPQPKDLTSLGAAESNEARSNNLTAEAHSAEKEETSTLLSITWSIENNGPSEVFFSWPSGSSYMYSSHLEFSGVTISSNNEAQRYHPIMDSNGSCLCSGNTSIDFKQRIEPSEKIAYWSMFSVPDTVDSVDLEIPGFDVIEDIPIS